MASSTSVWVAAAVAAGAALLGTAVHAAQASLYVQVAPSQRTWVPGHWVWNGYRHEWRHGYYVEPSAQPPYGHAYGQRRHRDRDRDGVADRYDRDRDGDGVPNRRDRRPDNPYRR